jgi:hypothetical protein
MKIEKILKIDTTVEDKILMILSNNIDIVYCGEPAMSVDKFKQAGIEILAWHKSEVEKLNLPVVSGWLLFSESKPAKMQRIMYEGNCGGVEAFYLYDNDDGTGTVNLDHGGTDIFERWQACS